MISVFNSENPALFVMAKSFLEKNKISFIPKGENLAGLEYTRFEILVKEDDYAIAKGLLAELTESGVNYQENFEKKHKPFIGYLLILGILVTVAILFILGLKIRE